MLHYNFYQAKQSSEQLIVLLHGFISDSRTFDPYIEMFTSEVNVVTIDLPGHGNDTSNSKLTWDFSFITQAIDEVLAHFSDKKVYLLGYSMGGRVALYYALYGKCRLSGLILESTSPGIHQADERLERQQIDAARAKVLDIAGLEVFVNDWEKLPLFYTQRDLDRSVRQNIRHLRLDQNPTRLAQALRDYGTGKMPNLWEAISSLHMPTLIMAGELDVKFVNIARQMTDLMGTSQQAVVPNVGHTIHVEDKTEFGTVVLAFLKEEQND
ncbi:MAG: 2-succinyl-6-hydroxy-2,4-cyclohexadiene-1-carboxylate synthase [Staphylococcus lugdunensis]|nr:2-succinyl-6-hydroxy-2,4-cyclohexadiene-1-carboxylate synthase [Staphylococcus lugdunensis]